MKYETEESENRRNFRRKIPLPLSSAAKPLLKLHVLCKVHLLEWRAGPQLQAPGTKLSSRPIPRKKSSLSQYLHKLSPLQDIPNIYTRANVYIYIYIYISVKKEYQQDATI